MSPREERRDCNARVISHSLDDQRVPPAARRAHGVQVLQVVGALRDGRRRALRDDRQGGRAADILGGGLA